MQSFTFSASHPSGFCHCFPRIEQLSSLGSNLLTPSCQDSGSLRTHNHDIGGTGGDTHAPGVRLVGKQHARRRLPDHHWINGETWVINLGLLYGQDNSGSCRPNQWWGTYRTGRRDHDRNAECGQGRGPIRIGCKKIPRLFDIFGRGNVVTGTSYFGRQSKPGAACAM